MKIVFFGLTITSSWGNGHASTYRSLLKGLRQRGHELTFYEHNVEWYVSNRDLPEAPYARIRTFDRWQDIRAEAVQESRAADTVIVGSYFPDGVQVLNALLADDAPVIGFYDIDTPITVSQLRSDSCPYIQREHIPAIDVYLSFTGGPLLREIESSFGASRARPLYCACDPEYYSSDLDHPYVRRQLPNDLSYMGTYSDDRQPKLWQLLLEPARRLPQYRFLVAGPNFPDIAKWPPNTWNVYHLSPREHRLFYLSSRATLNITRKAMIETGYSPSIRLFEAAACGTPIITDDWTGVADFFNVDSEILVARNTDDVVSYLGFSREQLASIGEAGRQRVLAAHTGEKRAAELENYLEECRHSSAAA